MINLLIVKAEQQISIEYNHASSTLAVRLRVRLIYESQMPIA